MNLSKLDLSHVVPFRYKKLANRYLLTNDYGQFIFLSESEFNAFLEGKLDKNSNTYGCLSEKNFILSSFDKEEALEQFKKNNQHLHRGTSLHIIVVTLRCNHSCIYCQASAHSHEQKGYDMNKDTAKKTVDLIFQTPAKAITIEFQGGEPMLNWNVLVFIVKYALAKNRLAKKDLNFSLVSNLTLMTSKRLKFLFDNKINICTSLDGPQFLHDKNRPMVNGDSGYKLTTKWIKKISFQPKKSRSALVTLSKFSLKYYKEIIQEYMKWGIMTIPLRPVSSLGFAHIRKSQVSINSKDFLKFYKKSLNYIVYLNKITKQKIIERMALVCLKKIFNISVSYADMRSPCGAGCGQVTYFYDGSVYTCDEARMLGNDVFKLGHVATHSYKDLMDSKALKASVFSSCTDGLYCDYCVYKPYCGVCPVLNWHECGTPYAKPKSAFMCKQYEGFFDCVFELLADKNSAKILTSWLK